MIPAAHDGSLKGLFILGENPVVSDPDQHHAVESLKNLDFLVVQDIFLTENGPTGRRGPAGGLLRRKGRHLLKHRATGPTGPQGGQSAGTGQGRLGDSDRSGPKDGLGLELRLGRGGVRGDTFGHAPATPGYPTAAWSGKPFSGLAPRTATRAPASFTRTGSVGG